MDGPVAVTVSAFNYGSKTGGFSGSLINTEGAETVSEPIDLKGVKSGKRGKTTLELTFSAADEYVLAVSESNVAQTPSSGSGSGWLGVAQTAQRGTESGQKDRQGKTKFTVGPKTAPVGKSLDIGSLLRVTLTDVQYQDAVYYTSDTGGWSNEKQTDLFSVPANETLALLRFDVENIGTEIATFGSGAFTVSGGSMVTELHSSGLNRAEFEGDPLTDIDVKSGQTVSGWLLARLPKKRVEDGAFVGWQRDASNTLPERQWDVKTAKLPVFELESWDFKEKQPIGKYTQKITVKNSGKGEGTFRGIFDWKNKGEDQEKWKPYLMVNGTVPPGESKTLSSNGERLYISTLDYRVRPFGEDVCV